MGSPWIAHCKAWMASHPGTTYGQALKDSKASYTKKK